MRHRWWVLQDQAGAEGEAGGGGAAASVADQQGAQAAQDQNAAGGDKSAAGDDKSQSQAAEQPPKSSLEAVERVMNRDRAKAEADANKSAANPDDKAGKSDDAGKDGEQGKKGGEGAENERLTDAEYKALSPKVRGRIATLTRQAREAAEALDAVQPKAQTYDNLTSWMGQNGITQDDFTSGLQIIALIKTDPAKAYEQLQPIITELRRAIGEELPEDLAKDVSDGLMSKERAQQLARERNERQRLEGRLSDRDREDQERQGREQFERRQNEIKAAITGWESQWRATDPDYPKKSMRVWERMQSLMQQERQPLTKERVLEIAKQSRKDVEDWLAELLPRGGEKVVVQNGGSNANVRKAPTTSLEAAQAAYGAH